MKTSFPDSMTHASVLTNPEFITLSFGTACHTFYAPCPMRVGRQPEFRIPSTFRRMPLFVFHYPCAERWPLNAMMTFVRVFNVSGFEVHFWAPFCHAPLINVT